MSRQVLVLGCGPAAAMAAIELRRLDYVVNVVGELRAYPSVEGVSERVQEALKHRGLANGLSTQVPRSAIWSGQRRAVNVEYLIDRQEFDAALINSLELHDIEVTSAHIEAVDVGQQLVRLKGGEALSADFIVDARGRAAGYTGGGRLRGPESVSICAEFNSEANSPMTLAMSMQDGWVWLARQANGRLFAQKTTGGESLKLKKVELADWLTDQLQALPEIEVRDAGEGFARSSTPILVEDIISLNYVRIGDAASAVDPLSGNGIFQALSSALTAVPVVNTILRRPNKAKLAMGFYRQRVEHLFFRFARTGRDFYRDESRWQDEAFWQARQHWPDDEPLHVANDEIMAQAVRPVIVDGYIEQRKVVITKDQPLGVWLDR